MTDPIQPFRDEFERCNLERGKPCDTLEALITAGDEALMILKGDLPEPTLRLLRAAKALQIAETEGPDAALLWKLSN